MINDNNNIKKLNFIENDMMNLLVVDDELIIVDSLYKMLVKQFGSIFNILKANSGTQAINIADDYEINILLTDINMPNIDGFKLREKVIENSPKCQVVFLSGYDEFEYVQTAIRSHGVDYVLKIEGDETIIAAINNAISTIQTNEKEKNILDAANNILKKNGPIIQNNIIRGLLNGRMNIENIRATFLEYSIPIDYDKPITLLLSKINFKNNIDVSDSMKVINHALSIIESCIDDENIIISLVLDDLTIVNIIQPKIKQTMTTIKHDLGKSIRIIKSVLNNEIFQIISTNFFHIKDIHFVYENLRSIFITKIFDKSTLISPNDYIHNEHIDKEKYLSIKTSLTHINDLELAIETANKSEFESILDKMLLPINVDSSVVLLQLINELYLGIFQCYQKVINRLLLRENDNKISGELTSIMRNLTENIETKTHIYDIGYKIIKVINETQNNQKSELSNVIIKYINDNISKNISLSLLSEVFNYNSSYISRIFKERMGINLIDYINRLRLDKSKCLLINPSIKIKDIARILGFNSHAYFCRLFKNNIGMTPHEYREKEISKII